MTIFEGVLASFIVLGYFLLIEYIISFWKLLNLLTIALFTKVCSTLLKLFTIQTDIFTQRKKRERRTTYNAFSKELIKHKTNIIQKIVWSNTKP